MRAVCKGRAVEPERLVVDLVREGRGDGRVGGVASEDAGGLESDRRLDRECGLVSGCMDGVHAHELACGVEGICCEVGGVAFKEGAILLCPCGVTSVLLVRVH